MWYKLLPMELNQIGTYVDPGSEVKERERIVGLMSDDTRKLYTHSQSLMKAALEELIRAQFTQDERERANAMLKAAELKSKADTVREIMWIVIKDEHGLWGENVGIRKGFRVVAMPEQQGPNFLDLLRGLQ